MRLLSPILATAVAGAVLAGATACTSSSASRSGRITSAVGTTPNVSPTAPLSTRPGFAPTAPVPPAGTFTPRPGSWAGANPQPGYRVTLLTTDENARTRVLSAQVRAWAASAGARLHVVRAEGPGRYVDSIQRAIEDGSDLIVTTGDGLVDPLALVTASNLGQQFLMVGAELAEPTLNVTAADWTGASFRGEGLGRPSQFDPATFTPERAARAVRAGVAAVLSGRSGTVVWVG